MIIHDTKANAFFFLNLFIGVIYGKYVDRAMEGMQDLTKLQLQWLDVMRQLSHARPRQDVALIASERQARAPTTLQRRRRSAQRRRRRRADAPLRCAVGARELLTRCELCVEQLRVGLPYAAATRGK